MKKQKRMKSGVLIVDDLYFIRIAIREILEKENVPIIGEAENGLQAIQLYEEIKPDIVLLDITMPLMDGLTALRILKSKYPESKVVMCSALGQQKYIIKAIQLGASDFVVKPFKPERLINSIKKAFEA
ncbi:MAG: response regulator [Spirochaetaceae bacterium]|nr:response regulator [Spirochaetaceae bacterium]